MKINLGFFVIHVNHVPPPPDYYTDIDDTHLPGEADPLLWGALTVLIITALGFGYAYLIGGIR